MIRAAGPKGLREMRGVFLPQTIIERVLSSTGRHIAIHTTTISPQVLPKNHLVFLMDPTSTKLDTKVVVFGVGVWSGTATYQFDSKYELAEVRKPTRKKTGMEPTPVWLFSDVEAFIPPVYVRLVGTRRTWTWKTFYLTDVLNQHALLQPGGDGKDNNEQDFLNKAASIFGDDDRDMASQASQASKASRGAKSESAQDVVASQESASQGLFRESESAQDVAASQASASQSSDGGATPLPAPRGVADEPPASEPVVSPDKAVPDEQEVNDLYDDVFGMVFKSDVAVVTPVDLNKVTCLQDVFRWPEHCIQRLEAAHGKSIITEMATKMSMDDHATAFSGIDSPGVAREMLRLALEKHLGQSIPKPTHRWAIEWDPEAQYELLCHPSRPEHIFGDISDFYIPEVKRELDAMKKRNEVITIRKMVPMIRSRKAVQPFAFCIVHKRVCRVDRASSMIAGTPCVGFSSMGPCMMDEDRSVEHLMAWAGLCLLLLFPHIWHENVKNCRKEFLEMLFEGFYDIDELLTSPTAFGMPSRRVRWFRSLTLSGKAHTILAPLSVCPSMFGREVNCTFEIYLAATTEELEEELAWARRRVGSNAGTESFDVRSPNAFREALTAFETNNLAKYENKFGKTVAFQLNQDASTMPMTSSEDELLTVVRNCGLIWYKD